mmetsp:Transcript_5581/g.23707  ORF Transcript_5581/g.23707 Transcript_5581/m.23707 type:complete len:96 (+) Transcript_5581:685-972(+)
MSPRARACFIQFKVCRLFKSVKPIESLTFRSPFFSATDKTEEDFEKIKDELKALNLATSFNLGKADIYPSTSGKANAASSVLGVLGLTPEDSISM